MTDPKPNLVFIICHDLGRHLPCYGRPTVRTPNLDRLAREGVVFDNYFCTAPQCSPSRGSIFTGRYPHANGLLGLVNGGWDLPDDERHLAAVLGDAGYRSVLIGNQHERREPERLGYQEVRNKPGARACNVGPAAAEWLRSEANREPFFLSIGIFEPHRSYEAEGYEADDPEDVWVPPYLPDSDETRSMVGRLHGLIKALDRGVGAVLDGLADSQAADNTLVVFTTDHGLAMPRAKCTLYDPGIETTLMLRRPGEALAGRTCSELLSNVDLMPTLLDLLDLPKPENLHGRSFASFLEGHPYKARKAVYVEKSFHGPCHPMRGVRTSTHKYIRNWRTDLPMEIPLDIQWGFDVRTLREHYVDPLAAEELYDLIQDPDERNNLALDPAHAEIKTELADMLNREFSSTGDPLMRDALPADPRALHLTEEEYWAWSREGATVFTQEEYRARRE